jgi:hypothetical protein
MMKRANRKSLININLPDPEHLSLTKEDNNIFLPMKKKLAHRNMSNSFGNINFNKIK